MPVFNGQEFLKKAIDSVLNQTFKDFEFIIINDGSTDDSAQIILNYHDPRIKYIYQENSGIGAALNKGCAVAVGKYIARMDSDDICLPNRLNLQYNFLENNNDYVLVSSAVFYIDTGDNILGRSYPYTNHDIILKIFKNSSAICHPAVMMRRTAYCSSGGYSNLSISEDLYLWLKLSQYGKMYNLPTPLIKYRIVASSISRSISAENFKIISRLILESSYNAEFESENIQKINLLHKRFKLEYKNERNSDEKSSAFVTNNLVESNLITLFNFLKLSDRKKQHLICSFKNIYGRFF